MKCTKCGSIYHSKFLHADLDPSVRKMYHPAIRGFIDRGNTLFAAKIHAHKLMYLTQVYKNQQLKRALVKPPKKLVLPIPYK